MGGKGSHLLSPSRFQSNHFSYNHNNSYGQFYNSPVTAITTDITTESNNEPRRLLIAAHADGNISVVGSISLVLRDEISNNSASAADNNIIYIRLLKGGRILSIAPKVIKIWSLETENVLFSLQLGSEERITAASLATEFQGRFVFLAINSSNMNQHGEVEENNCVMMFDTEKNKYSGFKISFNQALPNEILNSSSSTHYSNNNNHFVMITAISQMPDDYSQLLLGYSNDLVSTYHIGGQKFHRIYSLNNSKESQGGVASLAWHPGADLFAVGYNSGLISLWKRKSSAQPAASFFINSAASGSVHLPRFPVYKLQFLAQNGALLACGGAVKALQNSAVVLISGNSYDQRKVLTNSSVESAERIIDYEIVSFPTAKPGETGGNSAAAHSTALVALTSSGSLELYYPKDNVGPLALSNYDDKNITALKSVAASEKSKQNELSALIKQLQSGPLAAQQRIRQKLREEGNWPFVNNEEQDNLAINSPLQHYEDALSTSVSSLNSASSAGNSSPLPQLLLTCCEDGEIRFWNATQPFSLDLLSSLELKSVLCLDEKGTIQLKPTEFNQNTTSSTTEAKALPNYPPKLQFGPLNVAGLSAAAAVASTRTGQISPVSPLSAGLVAASSATNTAALATGIAASNYSAAALATASIANKINLPSENKANSSAPNDFNVNSPAKLPTSNKNNDDTNSNNSAKNFISSNSSSPSPMKDNPLHHLAIVRVEFDLSSKILVVGTESADIFTFQWKQSASASCTFTGVQASAPVANPVANEIVAAITTPLRQQQNPENNSEIIGGISSLTVSPTASPASLLTAAAIQSAGPITVNEPVSPAAVLTTSSGVTNSLVPLMFPAKDSEVSAAPRYEFEPLYKIPLKSSARLINIQSSINRLCLADDKGNALLFDLATGKLIKQLSGGLVISAIYFSCQSILQSKSIANAPYLLYLCKIDGTVSVSSALNGSPLYELPRQLEENEDRNSSSAILFMQAIQTKNQMSLIAPLIAQSETNNNSEHKQQAPLIRSFSSEKAKKEDDYDKEHYCITVSQRAIKLLAISAKKVTVLHSLIVVTSILSAQVIQSPHKVSNNLDDDFDQDFDNEESEEATEASESKSSKPAEEPTQFKPARELALFVVDSNSTASIYSLMELKLLHQTQLSPSLASTHPALHTALFSITKDARAFYLSSPLRTLSAAQFFPYSAYRLSPVKPRIFHENFAGPSSFDRSNGAGTAAASSSPPKSSGWGLSSLIFSSVVPHLQLFEQPLVESAPPQFPTAKLIRSELMEGKTAAASQPSAANDKPIAGNSAGIAGTKAVMGQNKQLAAENLEKIKQMENRSAEMEQSSNDFAMMAKKLKEKAMKDGNSWW
jgi:hypothetical protein